MPIYNYQCRECEHEFTDHLKMDDRHIPENQACPECGKEDVIFLKIGAPKIVAGVGTNIGKTSQGWKDLLGRIKKGSGSGNSIND